MPLQNAFAEPVPLAGWLAAAPRPTATEAADEEARVTADRFASEAVVLNIEASLRVFTDRHFFTWTQGLMQGVLSHRLLVCRLRRSDGFFPFDTLSYSTDEAGADSIEALCRHEPGFFDALLQDWAAHHFRARLHDIEAREHGVDSPLRARLMGLGVRRLLVHGTFDGTGQATSFYVFAGSEEALGTPQLHLAEMLVPFLHTALLRTQIGIECERCDATVPSGGREFLTDREQEVLRWMYMGKSNIEIGMILGISPLTVKNHVQAILRRLDVQNRAQAVGKAFKLRILSC